MSEANAAGALQSWVHEMIAQRRQGFRAGAGGEPDGSYLWLYFSRGEGMESRLVLRPGMKDGRPVILVDRLEGDSASVHARMSALLREEGPG